MDFHGLKRKTLQELCKKHGIPANLKNVEMADRLSSLLNKGQKPENPTRRGRSCLRNVGEVVVEVDTVDSKEVKKVKFSPENQMFLFERTDPREWRLLARKKRGFAGFGNSKESECLIVDVDDCGRLVEQTGRRNVRRKSAVVSESAGLMSNIDDNVEKLAVKKVNLGRTLRSRNGKAKQESLEIELLLSPSRVDKVKHLVEGRNLRSNSRRSVGSEIIDKGKEKPVIKNKDINQNLRPQGGQVNNVCSEVVSSVSLNAVEGRVLRRNMRRTIMQVDDVMVSENMDEGKGVPIKKRDNDRKSRSLGGKANKVSSEVISLVSKNAVEGRVLRRNTRSSVVSENIDGGKQLPIDRGIVDQNLRSREEETVDGQEKPVEGRNSKRSFSFRGGKTKYSDVDAKLFMSPWKESKAKKNKKVAEVINEAVDRPLDVKKLPVKKGMMGRNLRSRKVKEIRDSANDVEKLVEGQSSKRSARTEQSLGSVLDKKSRKRGRRKTLIVKTDDVGVDHLSKISLPENNVFSKQYQANEDSIPSGKIVNNFDAATSQSSPSSSRQLYMEIDVCKEVKGASMKDSENEGNAQTSAKSDSPLPPLLQNSVDSGSNKVQECPVLVDVNDYNSMDENAPEPTGHIKGTKNSPYLVSMSSSNLQAISKEPNIVANDYASSPLLQSTANNEANKGQKIPSEFVRADRIFQEENTPPFSLSNRKDFESGLQHLFSVDGIFNTVESRGLESKSGDSAEDSLNKRFIKQAREPVVDDSLSEQVADANKCENVDSAVYSFSVGQNLDLAGHKTQEMILTEQKLEKSEEATRIFLCSSLQLNLAQETTQSEECCEERGVKEITSEKAGLNSLTPAEDSVFEMLVVSDYTFQEENVKSPLIASKDSLSLRSMEADHDNDNKCEITDQDSLSPPTADVNKCEITDNDNSSPEQLEKPSSCKDFSLQHLFSEVDIFTTVQSKELESKWDDSAEDLQDKMSDKQCEEPTVDSSESEQLADVNKCEIADHDNSSSGQLERASSCKDFSLQHLFSEDYIFTTVESKGLESKWDDSADDLHKKMSYKQCEELMVDASQSEQLADVNKCEITDFTSVCILSACQEPQVAEHYHNTVDSTLLEQSVKQIEEAAQFSHTTSPRLNSGSETTQLENCCEEKGTYETATDKANAGTFASSLKQLFSGDDILNIDEGKNIKSGNDDDDRDLQDNKADASLSGELSDDNECQSMHNIDATKEEIAKDSYAREHGMKLGDTEFIDEFASGGCTAECSPSASKVLIVDEHHHGTEELTQFEHKGVEEATLMAPMGSIQLRVAHDMAQPEIYTEPKSTVEKKPTNNACLTPAMKQNNYNGREVRESPLEEMIAAGDNNIMIGNDCTPTIIVRGIENKTLLSSFVNHNCRGELSPFSNPMKKGEETSKLATKEDIACSNYSSEMDYLPLVDRSASKQSEKAPNAQHLITEHHLMMFYKERVRECEKALTVTKPDVLSFVEDEIHPGSSDDVKRRELGFHDSANVRNDDLNSLITEIMPKSTRDMFQVEGSNSYMPQEELKDMVDHPCNDRVPQTSDKLSNDQGATGNLVESEAHKVFEALLNDTNDSITGQNQSEFSCGRGVQDISEKDLAESSFLAMWESHSFDSFEKKADRIEEYSVDGLDEVKDGVMPHHDTAILEDGIANKTCVEAHSDVTDNRKTQQNTNDNQTEDQTHTQLIDACHTSAALDDHVKFLNDKLNNSGVRKQYGDQGSSHLRQQIINEENEEQIDLTLENVTVSENNNVLESAKNPATASCNETGHELGTDIRSEVDEKDKTTAHDVMTVDASHATDEKLMLKGQNRSLLLHGTPRRALLPKYDMKENVAAPKRPEIIHATTMKPALKRKALSDI